MKKQLLSLGIMFFAAMHTNAQTIIDTVSVGAGSRCFNQYIIEG